MAVVLAVPTCLLLVIFVLAVKSQVALYRDASQTRAEIGVSLDIQSLVHELQAERGTTNGLLGGDERYRSQMVSARERVDALRRQLRNEPVVQSTLQQFNLLSGTRADVDSNIADRAKTLRFYTTAITALINADPAADTTTRGDRQLRDGLAAVQALAQAKESAALERSLLNGVFAVGSFRRSEFLQFTEARAVRVAAIDRYRKAATAAERTALDKAFSTPSAKRVDAAETEAEGGADGSALNVDPANWWLATGALDNDLYGVQLGVAGDVSARAQTLSDQATRSLILFHVYAFLAAALVAAATLLAARSITRPLDALAQEADEIARNRLPDTVVRIQSGEIPTPPEPGAAPRRGAREITEVVAALRNVERTAVGLATEQAVLRRNTSESLANLGRRNQGLIRRQLGLITTLENKELDPEALGELFELDHLATRMRRNAESLLVLVDERTPRPRTGTASSLELVQSALGEVEQYRRVAVADIDGCRVRGHAVAELSHLLAELVENALSFSPPDESVDIHGWRDGAEYCLAVIDHGVGMNPADLARSNARLAGEEAFLVAPTRFLGHYVVGRLAGRLGVEVLLSDTPGGGVSALVTLPARLLTADAAEPSFAAAAAAAAKPRTPQQVSSMLNGFRAGVARGESR
ncbi:sensor histidine kinase [Actinacidiphila oryziradicis]|nr:nitrate- and nitrite sensing domain-containing protein [Actinacidiphila oryziradicis]